MSLDTPILTETLFHSNLEEIKHEKGEPNWSHQFVSTDHVRASPICKTPGTETDYHVHDEQWIKKDGRTRRVDRRQEGQLRLRARQAK